MKSIEVTYKIKAPLEWVWQAFVDPDIIMQWTGSPAIMSDQEGFEFSLWDGEIFGTNTKVVPHKLIEQDWYSSRDWQAASKVTLTFTDDCDITTIKLVHINIPDDAAKDIEDGWKDYYLEPMKDLLEA